MPSIFPWWRRTSQKLEVKRNRRGNLARTSFDVEVTVPPVPQIIWHFFLPFLTHNFFDFIVCMYLCIMYTFLFTFQFGLPLYLLYVTRMQLPILLWHGKITLNKCGVILSALNLLSLRSPFITNLWTPCCWCEYWYLIASEKNATYLQSMLLVSSLTITTGDDIQCSYF